ncbi:MAG: S-adenosyl-l-methionine hydroxide adenosyltransferase family protein [Sphingomonadales bacterium]
MIVLFSDFGYSGPYVGQVAAVLERDAPGVARIDLMHDAPVHDPRASAYLLAALVDEFPPGAVFLAVVDPGVGGDRPPVVARAGGRWFAGPGNGLFEIVMRRAANSRLWRIADKPDRLSASFHGRDLFAPVAARLARRLAETRPPISDPPDIAVKPFPDRPRPGADWPDDLWEVIYVDHFGNAMTGVRSATLFGHEVLEIGTDDGARLCIDHARTFSDRPLGAPFWYCNALGLVEIAINKGRADRRLGLRIGSPVRLPETASGAGT